MRSCSRTMSIPVTSSLTGCSTWSRAFSSMKYQRAVRAEEELERPGVQVADVTAGSRYRLLHRRAYLLVERRRGRLLDQLLVAPLDRAFALAEREDAAVGVAEHLDLDVPGRGQRLLQVERAVPERRLRLRTRRLVRVLQVLRRRRRAASPCRRRPRGPSGGPGSRARPRPSGPRRRSAYPHPGRGGPRRPRARASPAPCLPCAPSRRRPGPRTRGRSPRRRGRSRDSRRGSPSPGGPPRTRS